MCSSDLRHHARAAATDGCISTTEYNTAQRGTMAWFQDTYSTGGGTVVVWQDGGDHIVKQYPWCNHSASEGFFQVSYDRNKAGQYMSNYISWYDFTRTSATVECGHQPRVTVR